MAIADLSENNLPNLLIGKDDGTINYAVNTGKLGDPLFLIPPTPLKGDLPPDYHYVALKDWVKLQSYGVPYELISAVNAQTEPGFSLPDGVTTKNALKYSVWPVKSAYFPDRYYPPTEGEFTEHVIHCTPTFRLNLNKRYRIHFWAKADRTLDLKYRLTKSYQENDKFQPPPMINKTVSVGSSWTESSTDIEIDNTVDPRTTDWPYSFEFRFAGQSTLYIADVQIQEAL